MATLPRGQGPACADENSAVHEKARVTQRASSAPMIGVEVGDGEVVSSAKSSHARVGRALVIPGLLEESEARFTCLNLIYFLDPCCGLSQD